MAISCSLLLRLFVGRRELAREKGREKILTERERERERAPANFESLLSDCESISFGRMTKANRRKLKLLPSKDLLSISLFPSLQIPHGMLSLFPF